MYIIRNQAQVQPGHYPKCGTKECPSWPSASLRRVVRYRARLMGDSDRLLGQEGPASNDEPSVQKYFLPTLFSHDSRQLHSPIAKILIYPDQEPPGIECTCLRGRSLVEQDTAGIRDHPSSFYIITTTGLERWSAMRDAF